MTYSENEICTIYRNAKDSIDKIKLLEELAMLPKKEIVEILNKNGYKVKKIRNTRKKYNDEDFLELYNKGLNDAEIAREMSCSEGTVNFWRQDNKLISNYHKKINKKKPAGTGK